MNKLLTILSCVAMAVLALPALVMAESKLVCSIASATACHEDGTVGKPDTGDLERPTFIEVDLDGKKVTILAPESRRGEVSTAETVSKDNGGWLLAGVERGRPWSMRISTDGLMTLAITGDGEVWSVFGHTIRAEDVKVD
jgi:hypothetical protein